MRAGERRQILWWLGFGEKQRCFDLCAFARERAGGHLRLGLARVLPAGAHHHQRSTLVVERVALVHLARLRRPTNNAGEKCRGTINEAAQRSQSKKSSDFSARLRLVLHGVPREQLGAHFGPPLKRGPQHFVCGSGGWRGAGAGGEREVRGC